MKKILFVCSQNKLRSPTAEAVFCNHKGWEVRSAGLNNDAEIRISTEDVEWADYIFVMEPVHKKKLRDKFKKYLKNQNLISLGIPDNYEYMDKELIQLLENRVCQLIS
ncbi:low molecular weight protein tyrosine phosphatase family protein [Motiliproteus sp. MSK22-1]|uniref:low molecular weight protein tyrosine phosphatase family protein n=1 Tax=Motiliproteus sp. MSK22-1 TaxID=1897630 RepID=UPI0009777883|nr:phosphotyrosine protein phosphatase [Motiliproteus sp. MSK22-1]OMH29106.1 phosphotyrosine protein phosphatase [Motiliproteus sp. MSK22-1]